MSEVSLWTCQAATTYRLEQNDDGAQIPCSVDVASQVLVPGMGMGEGFGLVVEWAP